MQTQLHGSTFWRLD